MHKASKCISMNIRDVVKNTDSFCGSRPADGATRYYSIRLCSLTPNGLLFPTCGTGINPHRPDRGSAASREGEPWGRGVFLGLRSPLRLRGSTGPADGTGGREPKSESAASNVFCSPRYCFGLRLVVSVPVPVPP